MSSIEQLKEIYLNHIKLDVEDNTNQIAYLKKKIQEWQEEQPDFDYIDFENRVMSENIDVYKSEVNFWRKFFLFWTGFTVLRELYRLYKVNR